MKLVLSLLPAEGFPLSNDSPSFFINVFYLKRFDYEEITSIEDGTFCSIDYYPSDRFFYHSTKKAFVFLVSIDIRKIGTGIDSRVTFCHAGKYEGFSPVIKFAVKLEKSQ